MRAAWGLGLDPIGNLSELLEDRGIKVIAIDLAEEIDGLTARVRCKGADETLPVIVLCKQAWSERKRFTMAHELGHMVMDLAKGVHLEKAANRFAGAFLMPAAALWRELGRRRTSISLGELVAIKKLFGASLQAIVYRCLDLGILSKAAMGALFGLFTRNGWRKPPYREPGFLAPEVETPRRMERLCFRALAEGALGAARVAELLGWSVRQLTQRMDEPAFAGT